VSGLDASFPATARSVPQARERLRSWGSEQHLAEDCIELAELLVSELVTNAIRHTGTRTVRVTATFAADCVRISVADEAPNGPGPARHPSAVAQDGRGLLLVESLAQRWGAGRVDDGKQVWFQVPCGRV
jgi:anti-sigma regulatory factor (Ser/Thr protein kinase)